MALAGFTEKAWNDNDPSTPWNAANARDLERRLAAYSETQLAALGNVSGAAVGLNLNGAKDVLATATLTGDTTITVSQLVAGAHFRLLVTQDGTGGRVLTLKDGTGATLALTVNGAAGAATLVDCWSPDGTNIFVQGA